eukprot:101065_1
MGGSCCAGAFIDTNTDNNKYTTDPPQSDISTTPNASPNPSPDPDVNLSMQMDSKTMELLMKMKDTLMSPMDVNTNLEEECEYKFIDTNSPKTTTEFLKAQPPIKRITTPDKSLLANNERLDNIASVETFNELQHLIDKHYDTESDQSDLCETDKLEIAHRKSNSKNNEYEFMYNNNNILDEEYEMKQQLLDLSKQISNEKINELHQNNQLSQEILLGDILYSETENDEDLPNSNLFRDPSQAKWDRESIDKTKKEMTRQMLILASQNKTLR